MRKSFIVLLLLILAISVVIVPATMAQDATLGTQDNPIIWAFVPSSDSETVLAGATELTDLVQADTGIYITPIVATDYSAVVEAVCNGKAQMAALNTFGYILASSRGCANVGVVSTRFGSAYYSGQIIVKAGSDIKTLADLKGKTFCRPDAISTSGWIVPSITLRANGVDPDTDLKIVDAGGHPQVVTAVINGDCDAGATFVDARTDEQKPETEVIATTSQIPNDTISFESHVDADLQAKIVASLVKIAADPDNAKLLSDTYNWGGLAEAKDAFFDDFRQQLDAAGVKIDELVPTPAPTEEATPEMTPMATAES